MKRFAILAISCAIYSPAQSAPHCAAPKGTETIVSLKHLPQPVRDALLATVKDIVDAGQPFDSTDVVRYGAHFDRFAFSWNIGSDWIIATEHGGFAYNNPVYVIRWTRPGNTANISGKQVAFPRTVCDAALQLFKAPASETAIDARNEIRPDQRESHAKQ
jgi:hypothetical protein